MTAINHPITLSPEAVSAIQNDRVLKLLHKINSDLHASAIPRAVEVSPTEFKIFYSDDFYKLQRDVQRRINSRLAEILSVNTFDPNSYENLG